MGVGQGLSVALPDFPFLLAPRLCIPGLEATRGPGAVFGCLMIKGLRIYLLTSLWVPSPTNPVDEASPAVNQPGGLQGCLEPVFQLWLPPYLWASFGG